MSEKRKDIKGRLLRTGESQRKDLTYQFRYTDVMGKRRAVYANDLQELRKKERAIQKDVDDGIKYCEGSGCRFFPMTDNVVTALKNIIANRKKPSKEWIIDGYSGFLLLDKNGNPKVGLHLVHHMQWTMKKYRRTQGWT